MKHSRTGIHAATWLLPLRDAVEKLRAEGMGALPAGKLSLGPSRAVSERKWARRHPKGGCRIARTANRLADLRF